MKKLFAILLIILGIAGVILPVLPGWVFIILGWTFLNKGAHCFSIR